MNATLTDVRRPVRTTPTATGKLSWLLRRELWEHRGGFFWAPVIASGIFLLFNMMAGGIGQSLLNRARLNGNTVTIDGAQVPLADLNMSQILQSASERDLVQYADMINAITVLNSIWPLLVFGFVVFFYLLGALYDERKDRSVLFWKSLPVSDTQTVLSKLLTALVVGPLLAAAIAAVLMLASGIVLSVLIMINGGNPLTLYWQQLRPLTILTSLVGWIPVYALWALPTAGWLLLCSAWARSKPFLWAVLVPVLSGILVSWFGLFGRSGDGGMGDGWFWQHIVARLLTSAFPGNHVLGYMGSKQLRSLEDSPEALFRLDGILGGVHLLATPQLWLGALAGIAMIVLAIRLRRWRDDG